MVSEHVLIWFPVVCSMPKVFWFLLGCVPCLERFDFQTLLAWHTPQQKQDKYMFIYHCLTSKHSRHGTCHNRNKYMFIYHCLTSKHSKYRAHHNRKWINTFSFSTVEALFNYCFVGLKWRLTQICAHVLYCCIP